MRTIVRVLIMLFVLLSSVRTQTYITEDFITGLSQPIAFAFMPNGNIIITEKQGRVRIFNPNNQEVSTFWNFTDSCTSSGDLGVLGIALDPNYSSNQYVYVYFVKAPVTQYTVRIYRFIDDNNHGKSPLKIFEFVEVQGSNQHVSGNLHFRGDGKLYFSFGDYVFTAQQLANHPRGKIHRINTDGTAPTDNPFYDDGNPLVGNDDRIWAYGLRNSFEFCFSPINDSLYATENNAVTQDEINQIKKGKNYGWPTCQLYCNNPAFVNPIGITGTNDVATTAILVYNGSQMPELNGKLLYASCFSDKIFQCTLGRPPAYDTILNTTEFMNIGTSGCIPTMKQGPDGFIYASYLNFGKIVRIRHTPLGINNQNTPLNYLLKQNFPNPFNPVTSIKYEIASGGFVTLKIYNTLGMEVSTLVNESKQSGSYEVTWDASNFPSGEYSMSFQPVNLKKERKWYS